MNQAREYDEQDSGIDLEQQRRQQRHADLWCNSDSPTPLVRSIYDARWHRQGPPAAKTARPDT